MVAVQPAGWQEPEEDEQALESSEVEVRSLVVGVTQHGVRLDKALAELVIAQAQARNKAAQKVEKKKSSGVAVLPGKLTDCESDDIGLNELFLVEGDSAGGSAKMGRDKEFQAILPLRGKVLNTWEVDKDRLFANNEVHDIAVAIGVDPHSLNDTPDLSGLRYGKICILADADSDGLHIATLLCALFVKHFPTLVEEGHLYVAMPPLFRIDDGKDVHYALDEDELESILKKAKTKSPQITRFKGLGEMNASQLRETTMDPNTRRLVQLDLDDSHLTASLLDKLLAKKRSGDRKHWLEQKGNLADIAV